MDVWTSLSQGERLATWGFLGLVFILFALVILPLYYANKQRRFRTQISSHLVTNAYKLTEHLTPAELAYLFSPNITKKHVYASLMQLLNDGILTSKLDKGVAKFSVGPRVDSKLSLSDEYLVHTIDVAPSELSFTKLTDGNMSYRVPNTKEKVDGTKSYVFWWLVREGLRQRGVIVKKPVKAYFKVIFTTLLKLSFFTFILTFFMQLFVMIRLGEIDISASGNLILNTLFWMLIFLPFNFLLSFASVRLRGKFVGREWVLAGKKRRLLGQFDAYREYVRLVQRGEVAFESQSAEKDAKLRTFPYAIALGYMKLPKEFVEGEST